MVHYSLASLLHAFEWNFPVDILEDMTEKVAITLQKAKVLVGIPKSPLPNSVYQKTKFRPIDLLDHGLLQEVPINLVSEPVDAMGDPRVSAHENKIETLKSVSVEQSQLLKHILQQLTGLNAQYEDLKRDHQSDHSHSRTTRGEGGAGSSNSGTFGSIHSRTIKLDFPSFEGGDPTGWLYRAEQFFSYHQTTPKQKLNIASFHLEGEALQWYCLLEKAEGPPSWPEFVVAVHAQFGPTEFED
ncbi:hypothetical protein HHK36_014564 [Tetracentron sinense]|uniref:Retrotransposon gag domain-containing protein n=1 Tax=Tetracentron sinense TaxID=13715 RepID=A0A834Z8R6_TETSI|nr:hypothetical protein HHK36_014564 [Tetracentron sinense]